MPNVRYLKKALEAFGVAITRPQTLQALSLDRRAFQRVQQFHQFLGTLTPDAMVMAVDLFPRSRGENFQDIFAMLLLGVEQPGFFVEFGATDGVTGSNSYMMEKSFGWNGILAEPAHKWQKALRQNRKAQICDKCVWRESGHRLSFREANDAGLSTLEEFRSQDRHSEKRRSGRVYDVETISLNDLLQSNNAPQSIDYLSIDTEGSEYEILSCLDFDRWHPSVLTVEHNDRPERDRIFSLMSGHGYVRAPVVVSKYDDWYVEPSKSGLVRETFGFE